LSETSRTHHGKPTSHTSGELILDIFHLFLESFHFVCQESGFGGL
jgi:hypothetical protein